MNQEQTDYYKSNIRLLKKNHPETWKQIEKTEPEPSGKIIYALNGNPNLIVTNGLGNKVLMHIESNPEKDSADFAERIPVDHKGFVAILGMGLFYSALNILKERPHLQRLALFELDPGIFIQALINMDLSPILKDPRLILAIGTDTEIFATLTPASRTIQLEDSKVLYHEPSFKVDTKGYNQLKEDLYSHINSLNVDGTTTRMLGKDFLNNRFKHMSTIHHHFLLEQIKDKFNGMPAILVAGGPSLDQNIHLLKQVQEKAVIIAVDTVLPVLLKNDIHPHFLTCIDPNDLTFEKLANVVPKAKNIALVCASWINPKTPKVFPADQVFWTFTAKPMESWLNSLLGGEILTRGASTVAHLNLITAHMLGCDPVVFIGQDLAFPGKASHANGTILQGTAPTNIITSQADGETVAGINGTILRTNRSFLSMKVFFENAIANSDKIHINATAEGANIDGTQIMTLEEVINEYCKTPIGIDKHLKSFYADEKQIQPDKMLTEFNKLSNEIELLQKTINSSNKLTTSVLKEIFKLKKSRKIIKSFEMLSLQLQKRVKKIDKFHNTIDKALHIWELLEEITMEGLKTSERHKQEISALENTPARYLEWLTKNLNRLVDINKTRKETLSLFAENLDMVTSFHREEKKHIGQNMLKLARHYISSKNYYLAKPLLKDLCHSMQNSGEVYFYLGCIAAQSDMQKGSEQYFQAAMEYDPSLKSQIDSYLKRISEKFLGFAQYFKTHAGREVSVKYMVQKGLHYHPDNTELKKEFKIILNQDLQTIKSDIDANNYHEASPLITEWHRRAMDQENLFKSISPELVSKIFLYQARLLLSQKDYQNAITTLKTAMKQSPNDHDIHHTLIDTLFVTGDFNGAIKALNIAIELDNQFAAYWETIGESLEISEQYEDAIIAYERCFTHLPGNIHLLKKLGDCYMGTDQLEAAKAAYEQFKLKMNLQKD